MFRVQDEKNYYRFSWDCERSYRRLAKCKDGSFTTIDEDDGPYVTGRTYSLAIQVQGSEIKVWIDDQVIFYVSDGDLAYGSVALYCWGNKGSYFDNVLVKDLSGRTLFEESLDRGTVGWSVIDQGTIDAPSDWAVVEGSLVQRSNIHSLPQFGTDIERLGTFALWSLGGSATPANGIISTRSGNAGSWQPMVGKNPVGDWELAFPDKPEIRDMFSKEDIEDILLVITYSGSTPDWPA
jgi:hypothetical protein